MHSCHLFPPPITIQTNFYQIISQKEITFDDVCTFPQVISEPFCRRSIYGLGHPAKSAIEEQPNFLRGQDGARSFGHPEFGTAAFFLQISFHLLHSILICPTVFHCGEQITGSMSIEDGVLLDAALVRVAHYQALILLDQLTKSHLVEGKNQNNTVSRASPEAELINMSKDHVTGTT